jgi:hypothetical protein
VKSIAHRQITNVSGRVFLTIMLGGTILESLLPMLLMATISNSISRDTNTTLLTGCMNFTIGLFSAKVSLIT